MSRRKRNPRKKDFDKFIDESLLADKVLEELITSKKVAERLGVNPSPIERKIKRYRTALKNYKVAIQRKKDLDSYIKKTNTLLEKHYRGLNRVKDSLELLLKD